MKSDVRLPEFYSKRLPCKHISAHQVFWSARGTIVVLSLIGRRLVRATGNPSKPLPKQWYARGPRELVIMGSQMILFEDQPDFTRPSQIFLYWQSTVVYMVHLFCRSTQFHATGSDFPVLAKYCNIHI